MKNLSGRTVHIDYIFKKCGKFEFNESRTRLGC